MTDSEKLDLILEMVGGLGTKVENLETKVDSLETRMDGLETRMNSFETRMDSLETDLKEVKQRVIKTDLTMENEIRVNIQRVAEGHLDLSRKLNECIKLSSDIKDKQELQDIRINMHSTKLMTL